MESYNYSEALSSFAADASTPPQVSSTLPVRRPRKGHKKSRRGCFNCKRRKIKCQEVYPSCPNCTKSKVKCEYPAEPQEKEAPMCAQNAGLELRNTVQLQSTPTQFSLTDMRLFHHFLTVAYPHVPFGNDRIWVSDIAAFAHSYDYLVHSALGLAASHLNIMSTSDLRAEALSHRIYAMRGLNKALSTPPKTAAEGDAILATCYALLLQTSYIGESIEEFLRMLRGCRLVHAQGWMETLGTSFILHSPEYQLNIAVSRLEKSLIMDPTLIEVAKAAFDRLGPLCKTRLEKFMLQNLHDVVDSDSAYEICSRSCMLWETLATLPHKDFQIVMTTNNTNMQLLLAHCVALSVLLHPNEWAGTHTGVFRYRPFPLGNIYANMEDNMKGYLEWPMQVTGSCAGL